MGVFDPVIELKATWRSPNLSAGQETSKSLYEVSPDEVLEIFRIEIVPPVDTSTGTVKKLREVGLIINGEKFPYIHANSVMLPLEHPYNAGKAIDLGVPILHSRLMGRLPTPIETTTVKLKEGDSLGVYVVADEAITQDFEVRILAARARGDDVIRRETLGGMFDFSFSLDTDLYSAGVKRIDSSTFNELPGGTGQGKPAIYPWITYARNAQATTPNQWYDFKYPNYVHYEWQNLSWNLVNKDKAYLIRYLGVIPHSNSKATRIYVEGRETNPEYITRPLPEQNFFYPAMTYDTSVNANMRRAGPVPVPPVGVGRLIHGVKGGIQHLDNGTSIPADGVEIHVYGVVFILK